ncbi:Uncharacterized protein APZ42_028912 [Daphnia magna]|uniref:Integrase catalytic domain-containing protein n=1 Tax=Daphnia magna TaxID=35525 RepID=A0A164Q1S8_9CRUS|nr:Uncharacterized protein APZ42_028912 [Daphnia magna]
MSCQGRKGIPDRPPGFLQCIKVERPYEKGGDYLTKWVELKAMPTGKADVDTEFFVNQIFLLVKKLDTNHKTTSSYHPQENGAVERMNHTLAAMLSMHVSTNKRDEILKYPKLRIDLELGTYPNPLLTEDGVITADYAEPLLTELITAREIVKTRMEEVNNKQKERYDSHHQGLSFQSGNLAVKLATGRGKTDIVHVIRMKPFFEASNEWQLPQGIAPKNSDEAAEKEQKEDQEIESQDIPIVTSYQVVEDDEETVTEHPRADDVTVAPAPFYSLQSTNARPRRIKQSILTVMLNQKEMMHIMNQQATVLNKSLWESRVNVQLIRELRGKSRPCKIRPRVYKENPSQTSQSSHCNPFLQVVYKYTVYSQHLVKWWRFKRKMRVAFRDLCEKLRKVDIILHTRHPPQPTVHSPPTTNMAAGLLKLKTPLSSWAKEEKTLPTGWIDTRQWFQCLTPPNGWGDTAAVAAIQQQAGTPAISGMRSIFIKEFLQDSYARYQERRLRKRKQGINEPAAEYYYEFINLCRWMDPNMSEELHHLYEGLKPTLVEKIWVLQPKTCTDFLAAVRRHTGAAELACNKLLEVVQQLQGEIVVMKKRGGRKERNRAHNGTTQSQNGQATPPQRTANGRLIGFYCKGDGHIKRYCPKKKEDDDRRNNTTVGIISTSYEEDDKEIPLQKIDAGQLLTEEVTIGTNDTTEKTEAVIDTGAAVSIISPKLTAKMAQELKNWDGPQIVMQIMTDKRFPAHRMFNGDETSTPTVISPKKVVAERGIKQVILLMVDNHSSHLDNAVVKYCNENYITLLTFPPHCSHVLQPEDVGIYGPFKNYLAAEQQEWLRTHPGQRITIHHIAELSRNPFLRAFSPINIVRSFEKTGIYPFKEFLPDDVRFIPSIVTELPPAALDTNSQPSSSQQMPCSLELNNSIDNHVMEKIDQSGSTLKRTPFRSEFSTVENDKVKSSENSTNSNRAVTKRLTFLDIMPLPQVTQSGPGNCTRSHKGYSREATSPLEMSLLEEQHLRKLEKEKDRLARVAAKADRVKSKTTKRSN